MNSLLSFSDDSLLFLLQIFGSTSQQPWLVYWIPIQETKRKEKRSFDMTILGFRLLTFLLSFPGWGDVLSDRWRTSISVSFSLACLFFQQQQQLDQRVVPIFCDREMDELTPCPLFDSLGPSPLKKKSYQSATCPRRPVQQRLGADWWMDWVVVVV